MAKAKSVPSPKKPKRRRTGKTTPEPRQSAHEEEIRRRMEYNRQNPPKWKRELLRQIDGLTRQPGVLAVFREHVRAVAKALYDTPRDEQGDNWKDFFGAGPALNLPEEFYLLAAFHDVFAEAERMSPIMEWDIDKERERFWRLPEWRYCIRYLGYGSHCADLPDKILQPAVLQRYFAEVSAEVATATGDVPASMEEDGDSGPEQPETPLAAPDRPTYAVLLRSETDRVVNLCKLAGILQRDRKTVRGWLKYSCVRKVLPAKAYPGKKAGFREGRQIPLHAALKALHEKKLLVLCQS